MSQGKPIDNAAVVKIEAPEERSSAVNNLGDNESKPRFGNSTTNGSQTPKPRFGRARAQSQKKEISKGSLNVGSAFGKGQTSSPDIDVKTRKDIEKEPAMESLFADEDENDGGKVVLRKRKLKSKDMKEHRKKPAYGNSPGTRVETEKRPARKAKSKLNLDSVFANNQELNNDKEKTMSSNEGNKPGVEEAADEELDDDAKIGEPKAKISYGNEGVGSDIEIDEPVAQQNIETYVQQPIPGQGGYPTKLDGRFLLAWNYWGKLWKSRASEVDMWSYEVEKATQSNRFKHTFEFIQADIGPSGVVFSGGLRLKYLPEEFAREEWEINMVSNASAIAIGGEFIAVLTEDSCLRILALSGIDIAVYRLAGSPIALAASGLFLSVIYSVSSTLHVQLLNVQEEKKLCELPLAFEMDPEHSGELQWAHLSANGNLFVMDTTFRVQLLSKGFGWCWVPVLDLSQRHFVHPVWVEDQKTECLMTAGLSDGGCPDVRLPLEEVKLKFPMTVKAEQKEQNFWGILEMLARKRLFFEQEPQKNIRKKKKVLEKFRLKAFSVGITEGLSEAKCMDIANRLEMQVSEVFAAKLAFNSGMHSMSDSISAKSRRRLEAKKQLERTTKDQPGGGKDVNLGVILTTPSPLQSSGGKSRSSPARQVKRKLEGISENKKMFGLKTNRNGLIPAGANVISGSASKKVLRKNPFKKN